MTIEVNENLLGMWYYPIDPGSDWMGALSRTDDSNYMLKYRHRYYVDDKTGPDSEDTKNWYEGKLPAESDDQAIELMRTAVNAIASAIGEDVTEVLVKDGDIEQFVEELSNQSFAHKQEIH
jgi:hypothetical protein